LLKSLQKYCQTVFSRFLSMTIFIPAENTRHAEKPGQNSVDAASMQIFRREQLAFVKDISIFMVNVSGKIIDRIHVPNLHIIMRRADKDMMAVTSRQRSA
jgi:hypothetical protein